MDLTKREMMMPKDNEQNKQGTDVAPSEGAENRDTLSPAHWQGEPLPQAQEGQTQDVGFDQRGAGRARQFGRAGTHGQRHNEQERRPARGQVPPDDSLRHDVQEAFGQSGVDMDAVAVHVDDGIVQLTGHVANRDEKYLLERMAAKCPGIIKVDNRLEVAASSSGDTVT